MGWTGKDTKAVQHCAAHLHAAARLALIAVQSPEPEAAAEYLVQAMEAVEKDIARLRRAIAGQPK